MAGHRTGSGGTELRPIWGDLHLHTVVSPCAEVEMIPPLIVRQALALGLGLIAVTDHNTAENVAAVVAAARGTNLAVLPGMEVQTREEAHILCLFDTVDQVLCWQEIVYAHLPDLENREEAFGAQFVVDETGDYVRTNRRLLLTSTALAAEEVVRRVAGLGGLSIAAHVDRRAYSLVASLGFIPPGLALAAVEVTRPDVTMDERLIGRRPVIVSGDAHRLAEMRAHTLFRVREPTTPELALAFRGEAGRRVRVVP
jgi:3',5'-nucleoside bisphosphate phosphatase